MIFGHEIQGECSLGVKIREMGQGTRSSITNYETISGVALNYECSFGSRIKCGMTVDAPGHAIFRCSQKFHFRIFSFMRRIFLLIESLSGFLAMIFGGVLTVMVWKDGYFAGALMLVVTGLLGFILSLLELNRKKRDRLQDVFLTVLRRTLWIVNLVLSLFVIGVLFSM